MVREIVKLAMAAAVIVIAAGLIALFASGYLSIFKPGNTQATAGGQPMARGGHAFGGARAVVSPSPTPPAMPPQQVPMATPVGPVPWPSPVPAQMACPPGQTASYAVSRNPPYAGKLVSAGNQPAPSVKPEEEQRGWWEPGSLPGQESTWFDSRAIADRPLPKPVLQPVRPPGPAFAEPQPLTGAMPFDTGTPYGSGWAEIIRRLISMLPLAFPGFSPRSICWPMAT